MSTKPDGGPAFPREGTLAYPKGEAGMSLRQWYAGMALASGKLMKEDPTPATPEELAAQLFRIADAMITEGEKE